MHKRICTVNEPLGICGRTAAAISITSKLYLGRDYQQKLIFLTKADENGEPKKGEKQAPVWSIMSVMMLGVSCGDRLIVYSDDDSLCQAVDRLAEFIDRLTIDIELPIIDH